MQIATFGQPAACKVQDFTDDAGSLGKQPIEPCAGSGKTVPVEDRLPPSSTSRQAFEVWRPPLCLVPIKLRICRLAGNAANCTFNENGHSFQPNSPKLQLFLVKHWHKSGYI